MKAGYLFILAIIIGCSAQKKAGHNPVPPGTTRINDTLFADQAEVANIHWREWLYYLQQFDKNKKAYEAALPDTLVWRIDSMLSPYSQYYFQHPMFNYSPVVGVSYEQALAFCKWRTYAANQQVYFRENRIKESDIKNHINDTFPIRFVYRLPTKEEWEMIASAGNDKNKAPFGTQYLYIKEGEYAFNTKEKLIDSFRRKYDPHSPLIPPMTNPIGSYRPNAFSIYNTIGNVAEMISEKGIAKGGSFRHPLDSCRIVSDQHYTKPEAWLGFRCVAVTRK